MQSDLFISNSPEDTQGFGKKFAEKLTQSDVVAIYGELGAGKTQLIKGICSFFWVKQTVNSPTFIIVNEYTSAKLPKIYHFDFYRLKTLDEIINIGFTEYLNGSGLVLIEWPELVESILPENTKRIYIKHYGEGELTRKIDATNYTN